MVHGDWTSVKAVCPVPLSESKIVMQRWYVSYDALIIDEKCAHL